MSAPRILFPLAGLCCGGTAASVVVAVVARTFREFGVVPPSESRQAALLYELADRVPTVLSVLAGTGVILALWGIARGNRRRSEVLSWALILSGFAGALTALIPWRIGLWAPVLTGLGLIWRGFLELGGGERRACLALSARVRRTPWRRVFAGGLVFAGIGSVGGILVALGEILFSVVPRYAEAGLGAVPFPFLLSVAAVGAMFGLLLSLLLAAIPLGFLLSVRFIRGAAPFGPLLLGVWIALFVTAATYWVITHPFGHEVKEIRLQDVVWAIAVYLGLGALIVAPRNYTRLSIRGPRRLWDRLVLFLAAVLPLPRSVYGKIAGKRWTLLFLSLCTPGLLLAFFVDATYGEIVDFSSKARVVLSIGILVCVLWGFFVLVGSSGRRPAVAGVLPLIAVGAAPFWILERSTDVHYRIFEHTMIAQAELRQLRLLLDRDRDGFSSLLAGGDPDDGDEIRNPRNLYFPSAPDDSFRFHEENRFAKSNLVPPTRRPPIFLIVVDSARPRNMSCYGYRRRTTPNLQEFAAEAVRFDSAYTNGTASTIGVRHIFTARYSTRFMLEESLPPFWTQELMEAGYRHFVLGVTDSDYNGISMEAFTRNLSADRKKRTRYVAVDAYPEETKAGRALEILGRIPEKEGIFCYLHYFAPHMPWNHREGGMRFGESRRDRYEENLHFVDRCLGEFFAGLRRLGLYRDAIIIVTADHAIQLGEHGKYGGWSLYQEHIHIPLLIRLPGISPRRVDRPVALIDLGPTLVHLLRPGAKNRFHGISLLPLFAGEGDPSVREDLYMLSAFTDAFALLERGRWKTVYNREDNYWELYDLKTDPGETRNRAGDRELLEPRRRKMYAFLQAGRDTYNTPYHYAPYRVIRRGEE